MRRTSRWNHEPVELGVTGRRDDEPNEKTRPQDEKPADLEIPRREDDELTRPPDRRANVRDDDSAEFGVYGGASSDETPASLPLSRAMSLRSQTFTVCSAHNDRQLSNRSRLIP